MIIIEGPDGAGKTSLGQMLQAMSVVDKVLPSPRLAGKGDPERMKYETDRYIRLHGNNNRIAVDRLLFSEMAYGPVLRGKSAFTTGEYLHKLLDIKNSLSFVVFCLPKQLIYKADESPVVIEKMPLIRPRYEKMLDDMKQMSPRVYRYEWDKPNAFQQLTTFLESA